MCLGVALPFQSHRPTLAPIQQTVVYKGFFAETGQAMKGRFNIILHALVKMGTRVTAGKGECTFGLKGWGRRERIGPGKRR